MALRFLHWLWAAKPPGPDFPIPVFQIILMFCVPMAVVHVIKGSTHWWKEQYFDAEGVRTDSGVVIARWDEICEPEKYGAEYRGGEYKRRFFRYHYEDLSGRFHEHVRLLPDDCDESHFIVGSRLSPIEYLASAPKSHRYVAEKGWGPKTLLFGLGLLAAIIPIRLAWGAMTWHVQVPDYQTEADE